MISFMHHVVMTCSLRILQHHQRDRHVVSITYQGHQFLNGKGNLNPIEVSGADCRTNSIRGVEDNMSFDSGDDK